MPHPDETAETVQPANDLRILSALRKIMRAVDMHSRKLEAGYGITSPQLLCLQHVVDAERTTATAISKAVHLSASTVVGILDRLEAKHWITRQRDAVDRRVVYVSPTVTGRELCNATPSPLHTQLTAGLSRMPAADQVRIAASLDHVVAMLEAQQIDAAPLLEAAPIEASTQQTGG